MKTALHELKDYIIEWLDDSTYETKNILARIEKELLEKEKQQIVDAWENGDMVNHYISGEEYYNDTFKSNQ